MTNIARGNRVPKTQLNTRSSTWTPDEIETEALDAIGGLRGQWEDESVFVTEKVSYLMRNVIKEARKNYYGVFNEPKDEITGEDKTWVPMTEWSVESVVKSIDLDTKDIVIRAGNVAAVKIAPILTAIIRNSLDEMDFGQLLNDTLRVLARDGTAVVKTIEAIDPETGEGRIDSYLVDLINIWIDPAARSIQEASAIIERVVMSQQDIEEMRGTWENLDKVDFSTSVPHIHDIWGGKRGEIPLTEVWEYWGKIRKSWVTGKQDERDIWIEGHVVSTGIGSPRVINLIRENPRADGQRPYQEVWYKRMDGRWYGRGIAEMLFFLQEYVNAIVNIRKNNNLLLQNGIFLIRKGSGLTPDIINKIAAGGGLPVSDINRDVKQLDTQDFRQSSYTDEERTYLMGDRVTGAFDVNRGEAGQASASATATLTQDRHIRDTFVLVQEGIGFFIRDLIKKHYIPLLQKFTTSEKVVRITGRPEDIAFIDETIINFRSSNFIRKNLEDTGFYPEATDIEQFKAGVRDDLARGGKDRFVKYFRDIFNATIDIDVLITDEKFDRIVAVQQLRDLLIAFSKLPVASRLNTDAIIKEFLNLMGIRGEFFLEEPQIPAHAIPGGQDTSQVGRLLKQLPEGTPSPVDAFATAAGFPQMGAGGEGPPAGGRPPLVEEAPTQ